MKHWVLAVLVLLAAAAAMPACVQVYDGAWPLSRYTGDDLSDFNAYMYAAGMDTDGNELCITIKIHRDEPVSGFSGVGAAYAYTLWMGGSALGGGSVEVYFTDHRTYGERTKVFDFTRQPPESWGYEGHANAPYGGEFMYYTGQNDCGVEGIVYIDPESGVPHLFSGSFVLKKPVCGKGAGLPQNLAGVWRNETGEILLRDDGSGEYAIFDGGDGIWPFRVYGNAHKPATHVQALVFFAQGNDALFPSAEYFWTYQESDPAHNGMPSLRLSAGVYDGIHLDGAVFLQIGNNTGGGNAGVNAKPPIFTAQLPAEWNEPAGQEWHF